MTGSDYADDLMLLTNTLVQAKSLLHSLEQAAAAAAVVGGGRGGGGISLYVNAKVFDTRRRVFPMLSGKPLKSIDWFTHLGGNILSTENDVIKQKTMMLFNKNPVFHLISLFSQISAKKLQDPLFEMIFIDYFIYLYSPLMLSQ